ncbi:DsbC/DsbD-like thiol-disulfide interchange protein [Hyphomicrobiales bacterium]|nr:DsbC/DsbD-like thiol-disulfide interchange protein [Hyphomicrobiales bacterium]CAH1671220.1 DsbC/DsbD-like thiol-disulfide interchange protein [Hyphomicrobiales bacterium]
MSRLAPLASASIVWIGLLANAMAQDAVWRPVAKAPIHSTVQLDPVAIPPDSPNREVIVTIALQPGYKTYWRTPGDSGVPPTFDWSKSENLGSVTVKWPAPKWFFDGSGYAIGYGGRARFPVSVVAQDKDKPLVLKLSLDYAVCKDICIPAKAEANLRLPAAGEAVSLPLVDPFAANLPRRVGLGEAVDGIAIAAVEGPVKALVVKARIPQEGGSPVDSNLFVEGPEGWLFGKPEREALEGGEMRFSVPLSDKPKHVSATKIPLLLTLVVAGRSIEVVSDLDVSAIAR